ncbi:polysaccharide deacetylase family protein [Colwellia sp. MSW7]|uniref:Polysaccharide deacetylase family protein n=1 Tax=Colwellia maritima TaxID=2912588 RepID=A0ABS9WXM7_9GAMM|nr:polysaccharide deacetylase family protein [Colwellia maritima]MCI2282681.1 polysaccharide deacetylase family protein [Colwellia maritima]
MLTPELSIKTYQANLSWQQLKSLADDGVIIANHGFEHNSIIRVDNNLSQAQWLTKETKLILNAESIIEEKIGQGWRYYAYPYGEFSPEIQNWLKANKFTGFSQQSGAVGLYSDLTSVPRFPASMPYDELDSLRDKLNALPFHLQLKGKDADTVFKYKDVTSITFNIETSDFYKSDLSCYISGLGKQKIQWHSDSMFSIDFSGDLPVGRVRCNCTAPSLSKPGRYYWYSKPWFILNDTGGLVSLVRKLISRASYNYLHLYRLFLGLKINIGRLFFDSHSTIYHYQY